MFFCKIKEATVVERISTFIHSSVVHSFGKSTQKNVRSRLTPLYYTQFALSQDNFRKLRHEQRGSFIFTKKSTSNIGRYSKNVYVFSFHLKGKAAVRWLNHSYPQLKKRRKKINFNQFLNEQ